MVSKQIFKARGKSKENLLEEGNTRTSESKHHLLFSVSKCQKHIGGTLNFARTR